MSDASGAATFRVPAEAYDRHVGRYSRELAPRSSPPPACARAAERSTSAADPAR